MVCDFRADSSTIHLINGSDNIGFHIEFSFFDINNKDFTISTILGLGINDYDASNSNGIQFYPNPFFNSVRIDIMNHTFLEAAKTVINIYDVLGNIVRTEPITLVENFSQSYDLSNLSNAIYIVELTDGKRRSYARLIKI